MKAVKAHLQETKPDRVEAFEKGAQAFAKKIVANFKDYEFYTGENMNPEGMVIILNYRVRLCIKLDSDVAHSFFQCIEGGRYT